MTHTDDTQLDALLQTWAAAQRLGRNEADAIAARVHEESELAEAFGQAWLAMWKGLGDMFRQQREQLSQACRPAWQIHR